MNIKIAIVFLQLLITSNGDIELACGTARPSAQTDVTCVCRRTVGSGIQWFFNGNLISDCVLNSGCLPQPPGYTFSINVSEIAYEMTISAYDYNDCTQINCTDASNTNVQRMIVPSAINFDPSNPTSISEPTLSHSNGNISITTGCISGYTDVMCEWYTVYNGVQEKYTYGQSAFDTNDKSCLNCNDDVNAKKTCGFYHIESSENETKNVTFRAVLTHTLTNLKWEVNSANVYTVKVNNNPSESDEPANNKLFSLLVLLVVIPVIIILIMICVRPKLTNIKLEDTKMHLEWTDCLNCCCCCQRIFGYSIVCKPKHGQETEINKENVTKEKQYTLETLDPMAIYEICLCRKFWSFRSFAQRIYVITRKLGMLNDQGNNAKPNSIDVRWTEPDCITNAEMKYKVTCNEKVTEENTGEIKSKIKGLFPKKTYTIKVFAIDNGINSLLFAEEITTTDLKVSLRDVCYQPGESCVECTIKWTVEDIVIPEHDDDIPDHLDESNTVYFNVICYSEKQVVHKKEEIRASSYTIPKLYPDRSYSVYVYPVYHSVTFKPDMIELTTPYKPTQLKPTAVKSTVIDVTWEKPGYTKGQRLQYQVFCNEVLVKTTSKTSYKIENLEPCQQYDIGILTIIHRMNSLPLQQTIRTLPLKVSLEDVCYKPGQSCVECKITWAIEDFDIQKHLNDSADFYFKVKWYSENRAVGEEENIRGSSFTILELFPDRSYSVYVYAVYHSVTFGPAMIELTTPYKPTWEKVPEAKSTEIELKWKKPEYTGTKQLKYEVTCDGKIVQTTTETSCKIKDLEPGQSYNIQIFTIINKKHWMKSLPLQRTIITQPSQQVPLPEIQFGARNRNLVTQ